MKQQDLFSDFTFDAPKAESTKDDALLNACSIVLESNVVQDKYTKYIQDNFDLKITDTCRVNIPNKINIANLKDWNIIVICGASGSGKTTILKHLAESNGCSLTKPMFDNTKSLISNFSNLQPCEATMLLSSIGLASVPTWIRPYNVLSNGEQYRASLAKTVSIAKDDEIIFVDEYTSVVDRNVAKAMSNALQKYIRRKNKRIVLATCHYDILEWLLPDYIYDLNKGGALEKGDCLRRPKIELQVYRTTADTWQRFKKYHYMTSDLNESASCFVFTWNNNMVAFIAVLRFPSGTIKNAVREHRTVVLPDFQGLGFGACCSDFIAGIYINNGYNYYTKTVNPALGIYREKSSKWIGTPRNMKVMEQRDIASNNYNGLGGFERPSFCHKYIGEPIAGYENLLLSADRMRYEKANEKQLHLFTSDKNSI